MKINERKLNEFRFGKDNLLFLIILPLIILFLNYLLFKIISSGDPLFDKGDFISSLIISSINLIILNKSLRIISLRKDDLKIFKVFLLPFIFSDIIYVVMNLNEIYLDNINLSFLNKVPLGVLLTSLAVLYVLYYFKTNTIISKTNIRNPLIIRITSILFLSIIIAGFMYEGEGSINNLMLIKFLIFLSFYIFSITLFLDDSRRYLEKAINLNIKGANANHGDLVYIQGKNILLKEIKEQRSFFVYNYTEILNLYTIKNKYTKKNICLDNNLSKDLNQDIFPGEEVELFGKYYCIEINDKKVSYIEPYRIIKMNTSQKRKLLTNIKKDVLYLIKVFKNFLLKF